MSIPRSSYRRLVAQRQAVTGGTQETQEINFNLSWGEGIEIASVRFGTRLASNVLTTARVQSHIEFGLHAETGSLESVLGPNDDFELNSEIVASAILLVDSNDNALGEQSNYLWAPGPDTNFLAELGEPLLLASNPTFSVDATTSNTSVSAALMWCWYRYVQLTGTELLRLFALRR